MHNEAFDWVRRYAVSDVDVLDIGGRDINGGTRILFPRSTWTSLDLYPGPGVDLVADAAAWVPDREYDVVVCTEVFEHAPAWPQICMTAFKACRPGGRFIATMAGPGRPEHSGIDGGWVLHPGEYYGNVDPGELRRVLADVGFLDVEVDVQLNPADVRCVATKPE
jgi:hypothetical protein